jgi:hypothetical protein
MVEMKLNKVALKAEVHVRMLKRYRTADCV